MRMPAVFIGHGNPMYAIEESDFARGWQALGQRLPRPEAILCVSAHWETDGTAVTAMPESRTIHDFYGFPQPLFEVRYPAPGAPALTARVQALASEISPDQDWGLDHGTWAPLRHVFPAADIPVAQLSLNRALSPVAHLALAQRLAPLREEGILIVGSGNIVHNLRRAKWGDDNTPYDWAEAVDKVMADKLAANDSAALAAYPELHPQAMLAVPTPEHYLPMLYIQGVRQADDQIEFFNDQMDMGSVSMRSFILQ